MTVNNADVDVYNLEHLSKKIVHDSISNKLTPELRMAMEMKRSDNNIIILHLAICPMIDQVANSTLKPLYSIIDTRNGKRLYSNIGLLTTALELVKHLLFTHDKNKLRRILDQDLEYVNALNAMLNLKNKMTTTSKRSIQYDVAAAKYSAASSRLESAKIKIHKSL